MKATAADVPLENKKGNVKENSKGHRHVSWSDRSALEVLELRGRRLPLCTI